MKKSFLLFVFILFFGKAVYSQIEFIDFASVGINWNCKIEEKQFDLLANYSIGLLFHNIDLGLLADGGLGLNSDFSLSTASGGLQINYFGFNLFGAGLGCGIVKEKGMDSLPYIKLLTFFHVITTMKFSFETEYRVNSKWNIGLTISIPIVSGVFPLRANNVQYSHLTRDRNIIGKWGKGDEENGIFVELKSDQTFDTIKIQNGEILERRYGYFSTGEISGTNGMRMVYTDKKVNEGFGFQYKLEENKLELEIEGKRIILEKIDAK